MESMYTYEVYWHGSNNVQLTSSLIVFATLYSSIALRALTSAFHVAADPETVESGFKPEFEHLLLSVLSISEIVPYSV